MRLSLFFDFISLLEFWGKQMAFYRKKVGSCLPIIVTMAVLCAGVAMMPNQAFARVTAQLVNFKNSFDPGTIVIVNSQRSLFFTMTNGKAWRYKVAVPEKSPKLGRTTVVRKKVRPTWYPPKSIKKKNPDLPDVVKPGPSNPLGARALYLGWERILIHGTNSPWSIGSAASAGCYRMHNDDVKILHSWAQTGTPVVVLP